jgi:hypothetical protein
MVAYVVVEPLARNRQPTKHAPPLSKQISRSLNIFQSNRIIANDRCKAIALFEVIMRRYENRSTKMTRNRPLEEWGKLLGDVPTVGTILDRFLHHAQTTAITGRSYRLKDHATIAGKEDKNGKTKSKPNEPSIAGAAS